MSDLISSASNQLIKQIRSLHMGKGRQESDLFLVEGIHHFGAAYEGGWGIEAIVYSPDQLTSTFANQLIHELSAKGIRCAALNAELFSRIAEKDNPQGIMAVVRKKHTSIDEISLGKKDIGVALVAPQDPGNVGTIMRTLDAVGGKVIFLLDGGVDAYHPSSIRASMGSIFWNPPIRASFTEFVNWCRKNGIFLAGTSAHAEGDYRSLARSKSPLVLVLGSEQKGLSERQKNDCDIILALPMHGKSSSLNLAVAAGIFLYSLTE